MHVDVMHSMYACVSTQAFKQKFKQTFMYVCTCLGPYAYKCVGAYLYSKHTLKTT